MSATWTQLPANKSALNELSFLEESYRVQDPVLTF